MKITDTEPLDALHAECIATRRFIARRFDVLRAAVIRWQPAPCPPKGWWR